MTTKLDTLNLKHGLEQMPLAALARAKRQCEEDAKHILLNGSILGYSDDKCYCPMVAGLPNVARDYARKHASYTTPHLAEDYKRIYGVKYFRANPIGFFHALRNSTLGRIMHVLDTLIDTKSKSRYTR